MLTADDLIAAYSIGVFPMADSAEARDVRWIEPRLRGIVPLDGFHVSRSLRKTLRRAPFEIAVDRDFDAVMRACAAPAPGREQTWINADILAAYGDLHRRGHAHSVECRQHGELVGGLYGVSLGAAFFGESMFSRVADASKVALVHLVARLRVGGYALLDTQFLTAHLEHFGAVAVPRRRYLALLSEALARPPGRFYRELPLAEVLQATSQTS
ncbi:MAG: leucyl/phenylalanyl-tRNA--protein transferase [Rhodospirillales bacterium]